MLVAELEVLYIISNTVISLLLLNQTVIPEELV